MAGSTVLTDVLEPLVVSIQDCSLDTDNFSQERRRTVASIVRIEKIYWFMLTVIACLSSNAAMSNVAMSNIEALCCFCCCWISAVLGGDPIIPLRLSWSWFGGVQSQILYPSPRKWENCLTNIKANCCWLLHNMMVTRNSGWKICNNTGLKKRRVGWFARRVAEDTLLTFVEILEILWSP